MRLYPIKFKEIYKDYIWGGAGFEKLNKQPPDNFAAESWEVACHKDGMSVVDNGHLKGWTLKELVAEHGSNLIGNRAGCLSGDFPLLIKFINANQKLSVQVHPNDGYAIKNENQKGKNEAWVILDAKDGAELIIGVKSGIDKKAFKKAVENDDIESCLEKVRVKSGDVIYIPAGLVHAIGEGIMLAEIQQNSNVTYRVYDYKRTDNKGLRRPLHIEKALDVIYFNQSAYESAIEGITIKITAKSYRKIYIANKFFCLEKYEIHEEITEKTNGDTFYIYVFVSGNGSIEYDGVNYEVEKGDTYFIPANIGEFSISGKLEFIKTYIPNVEYDIINPLKKLGYKQQEIFKFIRG